MICYDTTVESFRNSACSPSGLAMNLQDAGSEEEKGDTGQVSPRRSLPPDLPRSLDDRHPVPEYGMETEMYDAWQGME